MSFVLPNMLFNKYLSEYGENVYMKVLEADVVHVISNNKLLQEEIKRYDELAKEAWKNLMKDEIIRQKIIWIWNKMSDYERTVVFDKLYNCN